jgi:prepilin-type N-terminal cleavage/methylation domain-containing protein
MELSRNSLRSKGFTIIELLITLSVAAVIISMAVPSLQTFTANNQIIAAQNSLVGALNLARFTAVTSGARVAICSSIDEGNCSDDNWDKGWIVFDNADENKILAVAEKVRVATFTGRLVATFTGPDLIPGQRVDFDPDGTTTQNSEVTILICFTDTDVTDQCQEIKVSPFGVISSNKTTSSI